MKLILEKIKKHKELIAYAFSMAVMLLLLNWFKYRFLIIQNQTEVYIGIIAVFFTLVGIWTSKKLTKPQVKTVIVEKEIVVQKNLNFNLNQAELDARKISKRELEVLELMAEGLSNQEIASRLFVSLHTIKTHTSNLFEKLEAKRRTQAVETAKKLQLIP
ncbi:MAG: DNA-binding response regulator [Flavobacterium sp.]|nr:DNA-binding response regulator [Flavobacterium sp.]